MEFHPVGGEELQDVVSRIAGASPKVIALVKEAIKIKGANCRRSRDRRTACLARRNRRLPNDARTAAPLHLSPSEARKGELTQSPCVARRQCLSGYRLTNPFRFGICTFGKVSAFIASFSPMILLPARIKAVSA
jgi:hypothetical protein